MSNKIHRGINLPLFNKYTGAFIFLCLTNQRLKYFLLSNKFIYVFLYQIKVNSGDVYFLTKPLATKTIGAKKVRVALSDCFNEENLPLKRQRVRINPAYNTFVRLFFFLLWFLFQHCDLGKKCLPKQRGSKFLNRPKLFMIIQVSFQAW